MKTQLYRHVTTHNGKFTWQLTILGHPCRTSAHFETPEEAAVSVDLVKHYLRSEFKLDLPCSLDGEQFSSLVFSRRHVDLLDSRSVYRALPLEAKTCISEHLVALAEHRDNAPPESTEFRRSGMINTPAVREWVEKLEIAESEASAFAAIDSDSFFLRLKVVGASLTTALKSLRLTLRGHADVAAPRLVERVRLLGELESNLEATEAYVKFLSVQFRDEEERVRTAVATLEAARPALS